MVAVNPAKVIAFLWLAILSVTGFAQQLPKVDEGECKGRGHYSHRIAAKPSVASIKEDDYDIHYLKFDIQLSHLNAAIAGSVTTRAKVVAPIMSQYVFELDDTLTVDSVKMNGINMPCVTIGQVRTVALAGPIVIGGAFTAQVFYHGYPRGAMDINNPGLHNGGDSITFTSVEPYFAHTWWPCKQSLGDKIDSVDMWVTVPVIDRAGSNGALQRITYLGASTQRYEWKSRYPIDYYLISVAVSPYDEYTYHMHFDGSDDSMPIINYVSKKSPKDISTLKPWLDSTALLINYFSSLFGRYPFWKEKYGHCYTPSFVNMEHQTMTSTRFSGLTVIAHELAHQWFGDYVTCGTWKDIWLNEGFAAYAQYLGYDHFSGHDVAMSYLRTIQENVTSEGWGRVYLHENDTANPQMIFNGRLTYNKAACVIHMLRHKVNDDEKFFAMLRAYLQKYQWKTATTADFEKIAEGHLGTHLDSFFQQWVYREGFPFIDATWNQVNNVVFLRINQTSSAPWSVFSYSLPLEIRCYSPQGDTIVTVYITQPSTTISFICNKTIDHIDIDPDRWMLYRKAKETSRDTSLNLLPTCATVYPNPATNTLYVSYKGMADAALSLYDVTGRKVVEHQLQWTAGIDAIDISLLPKGIYVYRIRSGGKDKLEGKVRKE